MLLAPGPGFVLRAAQQGKMVLLVEGGGPVWGFPYDPLLTPMLLHRSHLSLACLPRPRSAAFAGPFEGGVFVCSRRFPRAGSLALAVAKTLSGAEEPTLTLPLCRTIAFARTVT